MNDDTTVTIEYTDGRGERLKLEPRGDGRVDVIEETLTKSGEYRPVGHEVAADVTIA